MKARLVVEEAVPQPLATDTPAFRRWFGSSKVVDADGRPLVVYRGDRPGKTKFTGREDATAYIQGNVFFSNRPAVGKFYTSHRTNSWIRADQLGAKEGLYRAYLSLQKPLVVDAHGESWLDIPVPAELKRHGISIYRDVIQIDDLAVAARKLGYDGLIVHDVLDQAGGGDQYVAFRPGQIRLVADNPEVTG